MTINHFNLMVSRAKMPAMRAFYGSVLQPLGYKEMIYVNESWIGYGSDYPYIWLKTVPEGVTAVPTHIAFDAPDQNAVDQFFKLALESGARDNGAPGIRKEMSRQPYYAAFIIDPDGNNLEAVSVDKQGIQPKKS